MSRFIVGEDLSVTSIQDGVEENLGMAEFGSVSERPGVEKDVFYWLVKQCSGVADTVETPAGTFWVLPKVDDRFPEPKTFNQQSPRYFA